MADDSGSFWDEVGQIAEAALTQLAINAIDSLFAPKQKLSSQSYPSQLSTSPAYIMIGGYSRISGLTVFKGSETNAFGTIQAIHDGRVEPINKWYLNENNVTVSSDDYRVTAVYNGTDAVTDGRYTDDPGQRVNLQYRVGDATETAYPDIVASYPDVWTTDHRGDGTASVSMQCFAPAAKFMSAIFPVGIPSLTVVTRPTDVYDWRQDSTAGGSGSQRRNDPSSWGASSNPVVNRVHHEWFRWGKSWDRCIAPVLSDLTAEADICDEAVSLEAGGTEARYSCAGWYTADTSRDDIRKKFDATMDGWSTTDGQGRLVIRCGHYDDPTFVLTGQYIESYTWSRGQAYENKVDRLEITFMDPGSDYNQVQCDPWIIDDTGNRSAPLDLEWCPSFTQARRLAKRAAARSNPAFSGTIRTGPIGLDALGQRYIRVQNPIEATMADVVCEVTHAEFDPVSGQFVFEVISADPNIDAWNPATEEGSPISTVGRVVGDALSTPTITDATAFYEDIADGSTGARITIDASGPSRGDLTWFYRWKVSSATTWNEVTTLISGSAPNIVTDFVPVNSSIDVQVEYHTANGSPSGWSSTTTVSTSTSAIAPASPTSLTLDGSVAGQVTATWHNPASGNFYASRLWVNTHGSSFGTATDVTSARTASANSTDSYTNTGMSPGSYDFWVTAENSSGSRSAPTGPVTVTVT